MRKSAYVPGMFAVPATAMGVLGGALRDKDTGEDRLQSMARSGLTGAGTGIGMEAGGLAGLFGGIGAAGLPPAARLAIMAGGPLAGGLLGYAVSKRRGGSKDSEEPQLSKAAAIGFALGFRKRAISDEALAAATGLGAGVAAPTLADMFGSHSGRNIYQGEIDRLVGAGQELADPSLGEAKQRIRGHMAPEPPPRQRIAQTVKNINTEGRTLQNILHALTKTRGRAALTGLGAAGVAAPAAVGIKHLLSQEG
jgi:hypothetical protein